MVICYIFPILVCCTKKNLATLFESHFYARTRSGERNVCMMENRPEPFFSTTGPNFNDCHPPLSAKKQGDRIGRVFAYWAIVFFG
jgi:hypothetical protein